MSRRSTPERLYGARRAGLTARLTRGTSMSAESEEELVAEWEAEAETRGLDRLSVVFREAREPWLDDRVRG